MITIGLLLGDPGHGDGGTAESAAVTDRAARLLGVVSFAAGQVIQSITNAIDITDRAARLLGVVSLPLSYQQGECSAGRVAYGVDR